MSDWVSLAAECAEFHNGESKTGRLEQLTFEIVELELDDGMRVSYAPEQVRDLAQVP